MIEAGFYKTLAPFLRHMCMASDQCKPVVLHLYEIYCWWKRDCTRILEIWFSGKAQVSTFYQDLVSKIDSTRLLFHSGNQPFKGRKRNANAKDQDFRKIGNVTVLYSTSLFEEILQ